MLREETLDYATTLSQRAMRFHPGPVWSTISKLLILND